MVRYLGQDVLRDGKTVSRCIDELIKGRWINLHKKGDTISLNGSYVKEITGHIDEEGSRIPKELAGKAIEMLEELSKYLPKDHVLPALPIDVKELLRRVDEEVKKLSPIFLGLGVKPGSELSCMKNRKKACWRWGSLFFLVW